MMAWGIYMLKSALCLLLFYVFFKTFFSRDTFFRMNRFILLGGMIVCMILPILRLEVSGKAALFCEQMKEVGQLLEENWREEGDIEKKFIETNLPEFTFSLEAVEAKSEEVVIENASQKNVFFSISRILMWGYWLGTLMVGIYLGRSFWQIGRLIRSGRREKKGKYWLVLTSEAVPPFSFWHYIVMNENDFQSASREILIHEQQHMDKKHFWDLCFTELFLIIQWFNPAVWLLKKELQEIHEYEADNGVLNQGIDATQYQLLLVRKAVGSRLYSIANSFNHSKLKNRITMMLKERSNRWARLKVALLLPQAALFMLAFARPEKSVEISAGAFKVTEISGEVMKLPEELSDPEAAIQKIKNYLRREYVRQLNEKEAEFYKKEGGIFVCGKEFRDRGMNLLMNQKGNILFGERLARLDEVLGLLMEWKNENSNLEPLYLYTRRDRDTPAESWLKLLNVVKEFYDKGKQEGNQQVPVKVLVDEPAGGEISIVADNKNGDRYYKYLGSLEQLERELNATDYGKYKDVVVTFCHDFPERVKGMNLVKQIIAEKGWNNMKVLSCPPLPMISIVVQFVTQDTTGRRLNNAVSGGTCGQLEQRLMKIKDIVPGQQVVLRLDKSLNQTDIDNIRNMLKKHQLEIKSETYFSSGKTKTK